MKDEELSVQMLDNKGDNCFFSKHIKTQEKLAFGWIPRFSFCRFSSSYMMLLFSKRHLHCPNQREKALTFCKRISMRSHRAR